MANNLWDGCVSRIANKGGEIAAGSLLASLPPEWVIRGYLGALVFKDIRGYSRVIRGYLPVGCHETASLSWAAIADHKRGFLQSDSGSDWIHGISMIDHWQLSQTVKDCSMCFIIWHQGHLDINQKINLQVRPKLTWNCVLGMNEKKKLIQLPQQECFTETPFNFGSAGV